MGAYYNDVEPFCCEVLRARIADGRLPKGFVDERRIEDVRPDDLVGYTQCHFFAGIGGFPLGLRLGGMPDDFPIWTGGFPCQGISSAGKGLGIVKDKRSALWWEWYRLIASCRPAWLLVENVPALRTRGVDFVIAALEGIGYEVSDPAVVGAWAVGTPHRRDRVWIVGRLGHAEGERTRPVPVRPRGPCEAPADVDGASERVDEKLADAAGAGLRTSGIGEAPRDHRLRSTQWPARPGEPQHGWEAPRLVEFRVGQSINGPADGLVSHLREITGWSDAEARTWWKRNQVRIQRAQNRWALKAIGNSVVPQVVAAWAKVIYAARQGGEE